MLDHRADAGSQIPHLTLQSDSVVLPRRVAVPASNSREQHIILTVFDPIITVRQKYRATVTLFVHTHTHTLPMPSCAVLTGVVCHFR